MKRISQDRRSRVWNQGCSESISGTAFRAYAEHTPSMHLNWQSDRRLDGLGESAGIRRLRQKQKYLPIMLMHQKGNL